MHYVAVSDEYRDSCVTRGSARCAHGRRVSPTAHFRAVGSTLCGLIRVLRILLSRPGSGQIPGHRAQSRHHGNGVGPGPAPRETGAKRHL